MGGGGGKGGSQRQTTQIDPRLTQAILNNNAQSQQVANNLGVRQFAGFTPDQQAAFEAIRSGAFNGVGQMQQGLDMAIGAAGYQPQMISPASAEIAQAAPAAMVNGASAGSAATAQADLINRGAIRDVNGGLLTDVDLSGYMNPYTQNVIDTSLQDIERQRQMAQQANAGRAAAAGAFGGARHGLVEAETNRGFADVGARTAAGLRSEGFNAATGLAMQDLNRRMQGDLANQQVDYGVAGQNSAARNQVGMFNAGQRNQMSQFNAGLDMQGQLANAAAQNQLSMFNTGQMNQGNQFNAGLGMQAALANQNAGLQGAQLGLQGAGLVGNMAAQLQQMGLLGAGALGNIGSMQQQLEQQRLDAIRNLGMEQQQIRNASIGLMSPLAGNSTTTQSQNPGLLGMLGTGLQALSLFPSDERLKEEIEPIGGANALRALSFLSGNTYRYKDGTGLPRERTGGVMAQDVERVLPSAVGELPNGGGMKGVDYTKITGLLVDAVNELAKRTGAGAEV